MTKLKPCPFCGKKAYTAQSLDDEYRICCSNWDDCEVVTGWFETKEQAVTAWNRRAK